VVDLNDDSEAKRIAIIGSGIAGMSAAWLLNQRHSVRVFEQNHYVGGHSNTVDIEIDGLNLSVDTGFIVYNPVNYPNLVALFEHLQVPTKHSDMSFSASLEDGGFEYAGTDLLGLLAQPTNLLRPRFLAMVRDIFRFYKHAPDDCGDFALRHVPLKTYLAMHSYSDAFIYDHLMPMGAAIWSSSVSQMLEFPTLAFLRFFNNHGLVQLQDRPQWRTVEGGSREYVKRLTAEYADCIRSSNPVTRVERGEQITVICEDGQHEQFDDVVFACHSDEALALLAEPSEQEQEILGAIRYQPNKAVLHTDTNLMPKAKRAWASWNYLGTGADSRDQQLCVTYWMNLLQSLPTETPVLVTLNACKEIDPSKIIREFDYDHPWFDAAAIQNQPKLWNLQGQQNSWFCGAYFGSGFHEDGIQAGLAVAEKLGGVKRPWTVTDPSTRVCLTPEGELLEEYKDATEALPA